MSDELDDREWLAAEYVLGTLAGADRGRAESLVASDREFARLVEAWSARLAPISEGVTPVEPARDLWPAIEAALPMDRRRPAVPPRRERAWRRVGFWRWASAGALAMAASLALYIAAVPLRPAPQETRYMAVLQSGPGQPAWLVSVDLAAHEMTVRPLGHLGLPDRSYELWLVPAQAGQPRSLGLLEADRDRALTIPAGIGAALPRAAAFAVSLEPKGGSPTGLPTGPVVYQGAIVPVAGES